MKLGQTTGITRCARAFARRYVRSDLGSVAVEFVIVVPLMLMILLGFSEMYMYMRTVSLVEHTAYTLADSIGQMDKIVDTTDVSTSNSLGSLWYAATALAQPIDLKTNGVVYITSVCEKKTSCTTKTPNGQLAQDKGTAQILWKSAAPFKGAGMPTQESKSSILPSTWPFRVYDSAVVVEVAYKYTPFSMSAPFWTNNPGEQIIYKRVYVRPRSGQALTLVTP
jgi:Flp pilus assembly protein TadG